MIENSVRTLRGGPYVLDGVDIGHFGSVHQLCRMLYVLLHSIHHIMMLSALFTEAYGTHARPVLACPTAWQLIFFIFFFLIFLAPLAGGCLHLFRSARVASIEAAACAREFEGLA